VIIEQREITVTDTKVGTVLPCPSPQAPHLNPPRQPLAAKEIALKERPKPITNIIKICPTGQEPRLKGSRIKTRKIITV